MSKYTNGRRNRGRYSFDPEGALYVLYMFIGLMAFMIIMWKLGEP